MAPHAVFCKDWHYICSWWSCLFYQGATWQSNTTSYRLLGAVQQLWYLLLLSTCLFLLRDQVNWTIVLCTAFGCVQVKIETLSTTFGSRRCLLAWLVLYPLRQSMDQSFFLCLLAPSISYGIWSLTFPVAISLFCSMNFGQTVSQTEVAFRPI